MVDYQIRCNPFGTGRTLDIHVYQDKPLTLPESYAVPSGKALLVTDAFLPHNYVEYVYQLLKDSNAEIELLRLEINNGKNLEILTEIWRAAIAVEPRSLIGLGGGTICDLVGFAAATYKRGIPYVLFPTTTLAMVDACVSGKTGIDYQGVKNIIGAIHYPELVINLVPFLADLPREELRSGMAEVAKISVVSSAAFFQTLFLWAQLPEEEQDLQLGTVIATACELKAEILGQEPRYRIKPMYGHVIGQAIELLGPTHRRHGDCVAIGMVAEGLLAVELGIWNLEEWKLQTNLLRALKLPVRFPRELSLEQVITGLQKDKLATESEFRFVLPRAIGTVADTNGSFFTSVSRSRISEILSPIFASLTSNDFS